MRFLRGACAGVAAAALIGALQVLAGLGWDVGVPMDRERYFAAALNALLCGWLGAGLALTSARLRVQSANPHAGAFWISVALALAPWSWFALPIAAVLLAVAWSARLPAVHKFVLPLGAVLHLAPVAAFLVAPDASVIPLREPPLTLPVGDPARDRGPVSAARPDVLLLVVDTLRADAILDPRTPTPAFDALRARGVWADYAIAPCNQTVPSHMALLLGQDPEKTGMRSNESRWPTREMLSSEWGARPIASRFRDAGWRTAGVAANPLLESAPSKAHGEQTFSEDMEAWHGMQRIAAFEGFAAWVNRHTLLGWVLPLRGIEFPLSKLLNPHPLNLARTDFREGERTLDLALGIHEQLVAQPSPYFLFVNLFDPHAPYFAPPPHAGTIAQPESLPAGYGELPEAEFHMRAKISDGLKAGRPASEFAAEYAYLHDLYREEIAYVDALLGRLLKEVDASGRPTLILLVGDHGEAFGEHDNLEHRWTLHEEELRVPFLLSGLGVPEGRKLDYAPEIVDGTRTLLELCGLADPAADGRNVLVPRGESLPVGEEPLSFMVFRATVREGRWKLIAWISYGEDQNPGGKFERGGYEMRPLKLFDLDADPTEQVNLLREGGSQSPEQQVVLSLLKQRLKERMKHDLFPQLPKREINPKQADLLKQLGY